MELRHLRYFVAVADVGSLTVAAQRMLHTSQPSLSRQIRDLEDEVGAELLTRRARGIDLTPAGRAFLDHARSVLSQVEAASEAARRVARPAKPCFTMGFSDRTRIDVENDDNLLQYGRPLIMRFRQLSDDRSVLKTGLDIFFTKE